MAAPTLARTDLDGDRFYTWRGEAYYSVTSLIGLGVPKFALAPWYAKVVAEHVTTEILSRGPHARAHALIRRWTTLGRADFLDRQARGELKSLKLEKQSALDLAHRHLKGQPVRRRDDAAETGIEVHSEAEDHVLRLAIAATGELAREEIPTPWPEALSGYERSFRTFIEDFNPAYVATEATVFNPPEAYAGTLDAIVRLDSARLIHAFVRSSAAVPEWLVRFLDGNGYVTLVLDIKSGNHVHPWVGMQLAAYARGLFIGLPDGVTEAPLPAVDGALVLHLRPDGYHLRPVRIDEPVFQAFRIARENARWFKEIAGTVLGPDLAPTKAEAAA